MQTEEIPNPIEAIQTELKRLMPNYFPLLLTKEQLKSYTGIKNREQIEDFIRRGALKCIRLGSHPRYLKSDIERAIEKIHRDEIAGYTDTINRLS